MTVSPSIKIGGGGLFDVSAQTAGTLVFTTSATQYAKVDITDFWMSTGSNPSSCNITLNSQIVLQIGTIGSSVAVTLVRQTALTASVTPVESIILYVPPSTTFNIIVGTLAGGGTAKISGTYTIFQNS